MRAIIRRYRLLVIPFLVIAGFGCLSWPQHTSPLSEMRAPARVVVRSAIVVPQGVQVAWIKAEAGTRPVGGYSIERRRDNGAFIRIASVGETSLRYLDAEGRSGDAYRVTAIDSGTPIEYSGASEVIVAEGPKPGSTVDITPGVVRNYDALAMQMSSQSNASQHISQAFHAFDDALSRKDFDAARAQLPGLHNGLTTVLSVRDRSEWVSASEVCRQFEAPFEASAHLLPEDAQMDTLLVQADCTALKEAAE